MRDSRFNIGSNEGQSIEFYIVNDVIQYRQSAHLKYPGHAGLACNLDPDCQICRLVEALGPLFNTFAAFHSTDRISLKVSHTSRETLLTDTAQRIGFVAFSIAIAFSGCGYFRCIGKHFPVYNLSVDVAMLHHMLVSCLLHQKIGRRVTRRTLLAEAREFLRGAKKRLMFAADVARLAPGKDAPASSLAVIHSLLGVGGETLEGYLDGLAPDAATT